MSTTARGFSFLLAVLLTMSAPGRGAGVTLRNLTQDPASDTVEIGEAVTIGIEAVADDISIEDVNLLYRLDGGGWASSAMAQGEGDFWHGVIPPMPAGEVEYHVECLHEGGAAYSATNGYAAVPYDHVTTESSRRFTPFNTSGTRRWIKDTSAPGGSNSTNWYCQVEGSGETGRWSGSGVNVGNWGTAGGRPPGSALPWGQMFSIAGAFFATPLLDGGVGTIYFTASMGTEMHSGKVAVQAATVDSPGEADWETLAVLDFPPVAGYPTVRHAAPVVVNRHDVRRVRFLRTEASPSDASPFKNTGAIVIDNIVVSKPPADVLLDEQSREPAAPTSEDEVLLRCTVEDTNPDAPTLNRDVKVWCQWVPDEQTLPVPGAFDNSITLSPVGGGVYEGVIPRHPAGVMHYYHECVFAGYHYGRDPDGADGNEPYHEENASPRYWAAGTNYAALPPVASTYAIRFPVALELTRDPAGDTVEIGEAATIGVEAVPVAGVTVATVNLIYRLLTAELKEWRMTNAMTRGEGDWWSGVIPPLPAGEVEYHVECLYTTLRNGGAVRSATNGYAVVPYEHVSPESGRRFTPFNTEGERGWVKDTGAPGGDNSTNWYCQVEGSEETGCWSGSGVNVGNWGILDGRPPGSVAPWGQLRSIAGAFFSTPLLDGGVGAVYFTAAMGRTGHSGKVAVQAATVDSPGEADWETLAVLDFPPVAGYPTVRHAAPVVVNRFDVRRVRFLRTEASPYDTSEFKNEGVIVIDDIVVSRPRADILLDEQPREPVAPTADDDVLLRCAVSDVNPGVPSFNHGLSLWYQWVPDEQTLPFPGAFAGVSLTPAGGGVFEGIVPKHPAGVMHYYYECVFDGSHYGRDPDGEDGGEQYHDENASPRYWAAGANHAALPPVTSTYEIHGARSPVTLWNPTRDPAAGVVEIGETVTVGVEAVPTGGGSIQAVNLVYRLVAAGARDWWNTNAMVQGEGDFWSGVVPPLPAGEVEYYIECLYEGGAVRGPVSGYAVVPYDHEATESGRRFTPFNNEGARKWVRDPGGDPRTWRCQIEGSGEADRWSGSRILIGDWPTAEGRPPGGAAPWGQLLSAVGARIVSPDLANGGVGTIYFTACMGLSEQAGKVAVQVASNGTPAEDDWETCVELDFPPTEGYPTVRHAAPVVVNRPEARRVRFLRTEASLGDSSPEGTNGVIVIDNIVISRSPADVLLGEQSREPAAPTNDDDVRLRCAVEDTNPDAPSFNRDVKVWYQWVPEEQTPPVPGAFDNSITLSPLGGGIHEGIIPRHPGGAMHYYYECAFDGCRYGRDPDGEDGGEQYRDENASPRYWAAGTNYAALPPVASTYAIQSKVVFQNPTPPPDGGIVEIGEAVTVGIEAVPVEGVGIDVVNLIYRVIGAGLESWWNVGAMTRGEGDVWSGVIPPLPAGEVEYYFECLYEGGAAYSATNGYAAVPYDHVTTESGRRFTPFNTSGTRRWIKDTSAPGGSNSTNWYCQVEGSGETGRWSGSGVNVGNWGTAGGRPPGSALPWGQMFSIAGAFFATPLLDGGVGTIYFTASMGTEMHSGKVAVQAATVDSPGEADWETLAVLDFPPVAGYPTVRHAAPVVVNRRDVRRVRFLRTAASPLDTSKFKNVGVIVIDDIVVSKPPADVLLGDRLRNPGYPARDQDVRLRCTVEDTNPDAPTFNRDVKVWYQWVADDQTLPLPGAFSSTNMVPAGGGVYEGVVPRHPAGVMHYYYECAFAGYHCDRDPDGEDGVQPHHDEDTSPNYWAASNNFAALPSPPVTSTYEIRRYRSEYGRVTMDLLEWHEADPSPPKAKVVEMGLVDTETWQGLTLVTGVTNMTWYFRGHNRYTNDAAAWAATPAVWGDNDQDFPYPPIAGFVETAPTNALRAELVYSGFLLMRFNTVTNDYIAKRAVYQDFNDWQASPDAFEESLGLYGAVAYQQGFDDWTTDAYGTGLTLEDFQQDSADSDYVRSPVMTGNFWQMEHGRVIAERVRQPLPGVTPNMALMLDRQSLGRVGNTCLSMVYGVDLVRFRARAGINDQYHAVYQGGYGWPWPLTVKSTMRATEISPAFPYLSLIVGFQPGFFSAGSFYEVRLVQIDENDASRTDRRMQVQVWRWNADTNAPVRIARSGGAGDTVGNKHLADGTDKALQVKVTCPGNVVLNVSLDGSGDITFTDSSSRRLTAGGSVGFLTHDALPSIASVEVTGSATYSLADFSNPVNWYLGTDLVTGKDHWQKGARLTRPLAKQYLSLHYTPREAGAGAPDPTTFQVKSAAIEVSSLAFGALQEVSFHDWRQLFVQLRHNGGDADIVVDDLEVLPWRAVTRIADAATPAETGGVDYRDWNRTDQQRDWLADNPHEWAVLEGWIAKSTWSVGNAAELDRSRANPALAQALVTPLLTNGTGSVVFRYKVDGGRAVVHVERTLEDNFNVWVPAAVFTNDAGSSGSANVQVRQNFDGRIRVRLHEDSDPRAVLRLDALTARNYPPRDETTWLGYNILVTSRQTERLFDVQSCYLNNHPTEGAVPGETFFDHRPFVQTPAMGTGIGEIGFWHRVWEPGRTGLVTVAMTPDPDLPDDQWTVLTNLLVTAADFTYFSMPDVYFADQRVVRIYAATNGSDRVCLDNIIVTEPLRPGYEVRSVILSPAQPLDDAPVGVEVEIGRFIMNPQGIEMFLSYHVGTNVWGTTNWWTRTHSDGSRLVTLVNDPPGSRFYRTPEGGGIPAMAVDQVVQFTVWGTYRNMVGDPIFQGTNTFANPSWYRPVDLNETFKSRGWSPHYFVFSCPPGAVWINEVNYYRLSTDADREYVELIGPAGTKLGGWRVESIDYQYRTVLDACTIAPGFRLPNVTNGWGFFVWGDAGPLVNPDQPFSEPKQNNLPQNGGLRLVRSMGAWEHRLCYGTSAQTMTADGYEYIGAKAALLRYAPLHLYSIAEEGRTYADFAWEQPSNYLYSPGGVNHGQFLADLSEPATGYFLLTSVIDPLGCHGTQNGLALSPLVIEIAAGGSTQIVYQADEWYRIGALETNGAPVAAAAGTAAFTWTLTDARSDWSNHVTFVEWPHPYGATPVAWLANWSEEEIAAGDADDLDIATEYLLNTDPTKDTVCALEIVAVTATGDNEISIAVRLTRDESGKLGDINGTLWLYGTTDIVNVPFAPIAGQAVSGADFGAQGDQHTYTFRNLDAARMYYKAVIR
jgi:hypothetical protein